MANSARTVAVLSGGAPNGALMAGALCAIYEKGKTFHGFYTSGAGAIYALTFLGAKAEANEALRAMKNVGIHDDIYKWVPLGYKTFFKSGPFTAPFRQFAQAFKKSPASTNAERFYNDWIDLWTAAITPTTTNPLSDGLCDPNPLVGDTLDFAKLRKYNGDFTMNAYCIEDKTMVEFAQSSPADATDTVITLDHVHASVAYPFIYSPVKINGRSYYEGSALEPLNFKFSPGTDPFDKTHWGKLRKEEDKHKNGTAGKKKIEQVVIIDVLGSLQASLIRTPRHLIDAYGISIMTPVVSLANLLKESFLEIHASEKKLGNRAPVRELDYVPPIPFDPAICDWSQSNLDKLFDIGYKAGEGLVTAMGSDLPDRNPPGAAQPANF